MASVFHEIISDVKGDVAAREARVSFVEIKARSRACPAPRDVKATLEQPGCEVIAEIKRATPAQGLLARIEDPVKLAQALVDGGAALIACHTDPKRFKGSLEEMAAISAAIDAPVLCRDFIVDPYQIHEARCYGADMLTLRPAMLDQARLSALIDRTESLGMTALVEVRNTQEADRAIAAGASVIGVNARDFATMELNMEAFATIAPGLPKHMFRIALSGVRSAKELLSYAASGADAVVIGESIVTAEHPREACRVLVAAGRHPACPSR
ncbi:indole-3-glycerol phosphate synthase TrpC [Corynebacterium pelargi]|uniref:indole-3-glycerol-phosphate synthase n=1 Tax=Corynebacterium pelargi TaxID=1471400 RepID=A0A410W807_9CORY|nr:indole-3-glycerol phosphate synthase TrpC [Corynebacterium pelargi]QAU52084.1 Indole-3-glycerol phosphate synthase [Corynebacterium pelargi]GGG70257.1 indole-3-glycerol phosphate synthase [Corynebacterium pelargi]